MGKIIELTAVVIIVAYVAANADGFATVIDAIGKVYKEAVSALLSGAHVNGLPMSRMPAR